MNCCKSKYMSKNKWLRVASIRNRQKRKTKNTRAKHITKGDRKDIPKMWRFNRKIIAISCKYFTHQTFEYLHYNSKKKGERERWTMHLKHESKWCKIVNDKDRQTQKMGTCKWERESKELCVVGEIRWILEHISQTRRLQTEHLDCSLFSSLYIQHHPIVSCSEASLSLVFCTLSCALHIFIWIGLLFNENACLYVLGCKFSCLSLSLCACFIFLRLLSSLGVMHIAEVMFPWNFFPIELKKMKMKMKQNEKEEEEENSSSNSNNRTWEQCEEKKQKKKE